MNDDEYGTLLLHPLRGEPAGSSRLDVVKAMRDGRRRRRVRWWTAGSALAAVMTALVTGSLLLSPAQQDRPRPDLPPDPPMPTACTVEPLPLGDDQSAELLAGDPSGRWQAAVTYPLPGFPAPQPQDQKLLVWRDGELVTGIEGDGRGIRLRDLNSAGVGVGFRDPGTEVPYLYQDGKLTQLEGGEGHAVAINDAGVIAGALGPEDRRRAVRWMSPDAEPETLAVPSGENTSARVVDIAPDGTVLGTAGGVYRWLPDGTAERIEPPPAPPRAPSSSAPGQWAPPGEPRVVFEPIGFRFGWIYALISFPGTTSTDLYRYDAGSDTWQRLGNVFGIAQVASGGMASFGQDTPVVWVGRQPLTLPRHEPSVRGGVDSFVLDAVSDDVHVVVGTGMSGRADPSKPFLPMIWRCR